MFSKKPNIKKLSDEEIVSLIVKSKKTDAFEELYTRYDNKVYAKCLSLSKDSDRAKDLTHDIFLKAFINLSKFKGESKFSTWLYSITFNFCMDHLRKNKTAREVDEIEEVDEHEDEKNENDLMQLKVEHLEETLDAISLDDKSILLMKYQDDHSIKEIMVILDLSESAVKMKIKRAKAKAVKVYKERFNF